MAPLLSVTALPTTGDTVWSACGAEHCAELAQPEKPAGSSLLSGYASRIHAGPELTLSVVALSAFTTRVSTSELTVSPAGMAFSSMWTREWYALSLGAAPTWMLAGSGQGGVEQPPPDALLTWYASAPASGT